MTAPGKLFGANTTLTDIASDAYFRSVAAMGAAVGWMFTMVLALAGTVILGVTIARWNQHVLNAIVVKLLREHLDLGPNEASGSGK